MEKVRKVFDPFERPISKVMAVVNGQEFRLEGLPGVYVGKDKTSEICKLVPVHQRDVPGGIWMARSRLQRPDYYVVLTNELLTTKKIGRGFARLVTNFKGLPLTPANDNLIRRLGLRNDRVWYLSSELIVVEARQFDDVVRLRHCFVAVRQDGIYLREFYLPIGGLEALRIGYHTYNGDLSKLVAQELGTSLSNLSIPIITALDKAHSR